MTNVGPESVYSLFFLVGVGVLALPLVVATLLLRATDRYRPGRFAAAVVALAVVAYAGAVAAGFDPETGLIPLGLGVLYVVPPLGAATLVVRFVAEVSWTEAAAWGTYGWLPAVAVAVASWSVVPLTTFLGGTPVVGAVGLVGFAGYCGAVGAVGGLLGVGGRTVRSRVRRRKA